MSANHAGRVPAISISNLTKMYGNSVGVRNISFEVMPGEVLGFLGPNGAGKTTAMRVLVGLIHATSGTARILGVDIQAANPALRADIGYLPGALELYRHLTAADLLHFLASMRRVDCSKQITSLANRLDLDLSKRLSDLSKGNRQKVGVIQAFMHQPKVLILDEPTGGLDPLVQREFEDILNSARDNGAGVLLSSHVLSEVEHLTDRVAILDRGDLLAVEHIDNLKSATNRTLDLQFEELVPPEVFTGVQGVRDVVVRGHQVTCEVAGSEHELLKVAVANGVVNVHSREVSLTEVFISLVEGNGKR